MKKWIKYWPYALNVILVLVLIFTLKSEDAEPVDLSIYTQQDIDKAFGVKNGMSSEAVQKIIGVPIKKEFLGSVEEWHYCRTGNDIDEYISIKFNDGKVSALEQYTVSYLDIIFHHTPTSSEELIKAIGFGDCKFKVRWGSYGEKTPNKKMQPTPNGAG